MLGTSNSRVIDIYTMGHPRYSDRFKEDAYALIAIRYTFDSRLNRDEPDCQLCRIDPQGGKSCVKV